MFAGFIMFLNKMLVGDKTVYGLIGIFSMLMALAGMLIGTYPIAAAVYSQVA
jgi:hypothetical protein